MSERQIRYTLRALPSGCNRQRRKNNSFFFPFVEMKYNYPASSLQSSAVTSIAWRGAQSATLLSKSERESNKSVNIFYLITQGDMACNSHKSGKCIFFIS